MGHRIETRDFRAAKLEYPIWQSYIIHYGFRGAQTGNSAVRNTITVMHVKIAMRPCDTTALLFFSCSLQESGSYAGSVSCIIMLTSSKNTHYSAASLSEGP